MVYKLLVFKGHTVDIKLKEFRKVEAKRKIKFIPFNSIRGDKLLTEYIETLDEEKDKNILVKVFNSL